MSLWAITGRSLIISKQAVTNNLASPISVTSLTGVCKSLLCYTSLSLVSCTGICVPTDLSLISSIHAHMSGWCFLDEFVLLVLRPECACRSLDLFEQYSADKHYACA